MEIRSTKPVFEDNDFELVEKCPWCESNESIPWGTVPENQRLFCVVCDNCKLIYVKKRLTKNALEKHYSYYYTNEHKANEEWNIQREDMYDLEAEFILKHLSGNKKSVLDIGCSGGLFLDRFEQKGHNTFGVELGKEAANVAAKKHNVWLGDFTEIDINQKFDLIVFRGVIEHVPYPKEYLDKCIELLNPSGLIFITSTPDSNSICCKIYKDKWRQHLAEEHIMHFATDHFDKYFSEKGLSKVDSHSFYEETPYANIEQDILDVADAIKLRKENKEIKDYSPAFYGTMMSVVYKK